MWAIIVENTNLKQTSDDDKWKMTKEKAMKFFGIHLAMVVSPFKGRTRDRWRRQSDADGELSMKPVQDFGRYMTRTEFEDITSSIRLNVTQIATESLDQRDPYHEVRRFVDEFNAWRKKLVVPGPYLTVDESISAWDGLEYKYSLKGCPGLTYIPRKPKSRGVEMKACCELLKYKKVKREWQKRNQ
jgi:hypothetical protein